MAVLDGLLEVAVHHRFTEVKQADEWRRVESILLPRGADLIDDVPEQPDVHVPELSGHLVGSWAHDAGIRTVVRRLQLIDLRRAETTPRATGIAHLPQEHGSRYSRASADADSSTTPRVERLFMFQKQPGTSSPCTERTRRSGMTDAGARASHVMRLV